MCSILLTNRKIIQSEFDDINFYLKFRGPDHTNIYEKNGITFVHNLLSICGEFTPQPFVDANIVAMHNGEIYNFDRNMYASDGYYIIPNYKEHGIHFPKQLDGEFALCLVDFNKNLLVFSTDIFRTKPLWIAVDGNDFGLCSYRTPLEKLGFSDVRKVPPNSIFTMNLSTMSIEKVDEVYTFDLNQHKTNFDDWTKAFENSIKKRTMFNREKIFVGLSSGYDSGSIVCELNKKNVNYHTYTVLGKENQEVLNLRVKDKGTFISPTSELYERAHKYIVDNVERYKYTICSSSSDYNEFWLDLQDDSGSNGLSIVCEKAKSDGIKIYLSGAGADEIFSDYGFNGHKIYQHSNFGGLFPKNLSDIFPWNSFYGSSMESYLAKEEYVSGAYGIEGRYPFLDKEVVQEFLWLDHRLKNSEYKSVLDHYLRVNNYPYVKNQKIGF
jgi:asparagine synthetase B (glutamine-hydrolysing)